MSMMSSITITITITNTLMLPLQALEVTYSYWDGSGHRKVIQTKKGATIGKFMEAVKAQLLDEFKELRSISSEDLLYVKEDLIIPQVCIRYCMRKGHEIVI